MDVVLISKPFRLVRKVTLERIMGVSLRHTERTNFNKLLFPIFPVSVLLIHLQVLSPRLTRQPSGDGIKRDYLPHTTTQQ